MAKRDAQATKAVHDVSLTNETEVRLRQAKLSRLAIDKAIAKIALLEPEELSIKDAVALLRLGLEQERKALGMADVITTPLLDDRKSPDEISAVQQAMAIIGSLRVLGGRGVTNP